MKKWQIILLSVCGAIIAVAAGGRYVYTKYVMPKYIVPVLEQVAQAVNDKTIQSEILDYVDELEEEGVLDSSVVNKYIAKYAEPEYYAEPEMPEKKINETPAVTINDQVSSAQAQFGIVSVKVNDMPVDESKYTYSTKTAENEKASAEILVALKEERVYEGASDYGEDGYYSDFDDIDEFDDVDDIDEFDDYDEDAPKGKKSSNGGNSSSGSKESGGRISPWGMSGQEKDSDKETTSKEKDKTSSGGTALYNRAKNVMSAADLAAVYDLATKVDIAYVKSVASDKDELKSYLTAVLEDSEIAKAMELYLKYAYLLGD